MGKTIKVRASDKMVEDLEKLKEELDATSFSETVRRAIASEVVIRSRLKEVRELRIVGENEDGEDLLVTIT